MSMNVMEYMRAQAKLAKLDLPTKAEFGQIMHDDEVSEETKQEILKKLEGAGGYENLQD